MYRDRGGGSSKAEIVGGKSKREESLLKKRREGLQAQQFAPSIPSNLEKKLESLPQMVSGVWTDNAALQLEATTQFRKLLSIERSPPIEEVIQAGVVPRFVEFLARDDYPKLQVWARCLNWITCAGLFYASSSSFSFGCQDRSYMC